jgi:hypothetical protein
LATLPDDNEQIVVPRFGKILAIPEQIKDNRIKILFGLSVALTTFAPQPFGALAAFCIGILAVEFRK